MQTSNTLWRALETHTKTFLVLILSAGLIGLPGMSRAQSALDAVQQLATPVLGAVGGVSSDDMMSVLEGAAKQGQPSALWQLAEMYANGIGVEKDQVRAFNYFSKIANDYADAPPNSIDAEVVARSFVRIGDYFRSGLPDAGIEVDKEQARALLFHAATYFGDADAQYRVGLLYLEGEDMEPNPMQSMRWLSLAAHKNHVGAQAVLGNLLFNGHQIGGNGIEPQPVEGLMWLSLAYEGTFGSQDAVWIGELLTKAMLLATPEQREAARKASDMARDRLALN